MTDDNGMKGKIVNAVYDPSWYLEPRLDFEPNPVTMISFDHPVHGLIAFLLPISEVVRISDTMKKQLELYNRLKDKVNRTIN